MYRIEYEQNLNRIEEFLCLLFLVTYLKSSFFECPICPSKFGSKQKMNLHIETVHEGKKPFECRLCPAKFAQKGDMKRHIETVHEGKKPFECPMCHDRFGLKSNMKHHIKGNSCNKEKF